MKTPVFTDMNSPLGHYVGNALEIKESIEYLKGKRLPDIHQITKNLAIEMLILTNTAQSRDEAGKMVENVIDNGSALDYFKKFVSLQGGNPDVCDNLSLLPQAKYEIPIICDSDGWIKAINSQQIGYALVDIGAGRKTLDSSLDYSTGAFLPFKIGDQVNQNEELGKVFCNNEENGRKVAKKIADSYQITKEKIEKPSVIIGVKNKYYSRQSE